MRQSTSQQMSASEPAALEGATGEDTEQVRVVPAPPPSGARRKSPSQCLDGLRHLGRVAESLSLESLAFELFFAAARIESTGKVELVRSQLEEIATLVTDFEARFYRRAVRLLAGRRDGELGATLAGATAPAR